MSKTRNSIKGIFLIFALIAAFVLLFMGRYYEKHNENKKKAVQIAQQYLAQKYSQEMQFESVHYSWIDQAKYYIYFVSTDTGIHFSVTMWPESLSIPNGKIDYNMPLGDDYLSSFFYSETKDSILPNTKSIWGENADIKVVSLSGMGYPSRSTIKPTEQMTAREMEPFYNYGFYVHPNRALKNELRTEEAQRILEMFHSVKEQDYHPDEILVWYQTGKDEKSKVLTDPKTWAEMYIEFEDWAEITSVEQIEKVIDVQWGEK